MPSFSRLTVALSSSCFLGRRIGARNAHGYTSLTAGRFTTAFQLQRVSRIRSWLFLFDLRFNLSHLSGTADIASDVGTIPTAGVDRRSGIGIPYELRFFLCRVEPPCAKHLFMVYRQAVQHFIYIDYSLLIFEGGTGRRPKLTTSTYRREWALNPHLLLDHF